MRTRALLLPVDLLIAAAVIGQEADSSRMEPAVDTVQTAAMPLEPSVGMKHVDGSPGTKPFFSLPTYRISIGASFDFIEKFKPSNVYGDLMIDLPEILRTKRSTLGFHGGIYQVRNITVDSFIPEQMYLISTTPFPGLDPESLSDSSIVQASSASGVKRIVADNLCFFAALYRPWYLATETPGSSGLYHLFYLGVVHRRERVSESFTSTADDQVFISAGPDLPELPRDRLYTQRRDDLLVGFGQMLRHEFDDLALQFYGVVTCLPAPWRGGYLMSFNAIGSRSGLIAGAEIRMDPLIGGRQYNVFLAKTFKIAEMARLVTSY